MSENSSAQFWKSVYDYESQRYVECVKCKASVTHWKACPECGSGGHIPINRARKKAERRWHRDMKAIFDSSLVAAAIVVGTALHAGASEPLSMKDIDAICRTAYAEARGEGVIGQLAVIDVTLNRAAIKSFGGDVQRVINKKNAFEPVTKSGGWNNLPSVPNDELKVCENVVILAALGVQYGVGLPDVTNGATYFQNEEIVADRARKNKVPATLVGFNGKPKTAVIGRHTFYKDSGSTTQTTRQAEEIDATNDRYSLSVGDGDIDDLETDGAGS